jgi:S1-C subfamily serine protease
MKRFLAKLALALAVAVVPCFPLSAPQSSMREQSVSEVVKASDAAVVLIETTDSSGRPLSQGSGFIISQDGLIVTNYHVIDGAASVSVTLSNGASFSGQGTVSASKDADFALLKVPGKNLPFIHLAASNSVTTGERVIAIGSPLGLQNSVSDGIVSGLRTVDGVPYVQTSAPISHGDSGGPLLNSHGAAIGVLTFGLKAGENLNFALSVDVLRPCIGSRSVIPFAPTSKKASLSEAPAAGAYPRSGDSELDPPPLRVSLTTQDQDLETFDLYKLDWRRGQVDSLGNLVIDLDNGSDWVISAITAKVTGTDEAGHTMSRLCSLRPYSQGPNASWAFPEPLSGSKVYAELGFTPGSYFHPAQWTIIGAKGHLKRAIAAHLELGITFYTKGDLVAAIAECQQALKARYIGFYPEAHYCLGNALLAEGNYYGSIAEYEHAYRSKLQPAYAHYGVAYALYKLGNVSGATEEMRKALSLAPDDETVRQGYETLVKLANP